MTGHTEQARLVAMLQNELIGWAALSRLSARKVYAGVADLSIYIGPQYRGQGCRQTAFAGPYR